MQSSSDGRSSSIKMKYPTRTVKASANRRRLWTAAACCRFVVAAACCGWDGAGAGGKFELTVTVFHESWVPLPGDAKVWPVDVKADGAVLPVVERDGGPAVKLLAGTIQLEGAFRWSAIPQRITVPKQIGLLALSI